MVGGTVRLTSACTVATTRLNEPPVRAEEVLLALSAPSCQDDKTTEEGGKTKSSILLVSLADLNPSKDGIY